MESRNVPSARQGGGAELSAADVIERLRRHAEGRAARNPRGLLHRGDHDLNPDMRRAAVAAVDAAVLVPLVECEAGLRVVLTRRSEHLTDHAGQISFPGGRVEPGDRDAAAAALREAEEEIGLAAERVRLVGALDTYLTRTGFRVSPVVGLVRPPLTLAPDGVEAAEVFDVPLAFFLRPGARCTHSRVYDGLERLFYAFPYGDHYIWGATAGILVNLVEVLREPC